MKQTLLLTTLLFLFQNVVFTQNYNSYFTGNSQDLITSPTGGVCLMGGASESDDAMVWFLEAANGGDVLVFRASGSDGYNTYLYSDLGVTVNSVETIVFNDATASDETYIHEKINKAEAIWFAGGDQWDYISYWRNTAIDSLINKAIADRNIVVGGTSAGMAIQGDFYFSAQNSTVSSNTALNNPYDINVTVDSTSFISHNHLTEAITDTHFDNPDRKGRLVVFLSRILVDYDIQAKAIACDEYTAVCIGTDGIAKVFGDYPNYDDNAYFIQTNCELSNPAPEACIANTALDWNHDGAALKVYAVKGTTTGANTFNLNNWLEGLGGDWQDWSVSGGVLTEQDGAAPNCTNTAINQNHKDNIELYPNPLADKLMLKNLSKTERYKSLDIFTASGELVLRKKIRNESNIIDVNYLPDGVYFVHIKTISGDIIVKKAVKL
jgi:cyanophycinase-like exopeptidase